MSGMRRAVIAVILAAAMLAAAGCGKQNDVTGFSSKGLVKGTVVTGGSPVPDAQVYIDGALAGTTAPDGSLALDLDSGQYTVYLVVGGVQTASAVIQIGDGDYRATFDVTRNPDRTLGLTVTLIPLPGEEEEEVGCAAASLADLAAAVEALDPAAFSNGNGKRTFLKKIEVVIEQAEEGSCRGALQKLTNDVAAKADGCALTGAPDANDWIVDCSAQATLAPLFSTAIAELQAAAAAPPDDDEEDDDEEEEDD